MKRILFLAILIAFNVTTHSAEPASPATSNEGASEYPKIDSTLGCLGSSV